MALFFLLVGALAFSACSSLVVKSDYDQEVDFSQYKTYRWVPASRAPASVGDVGESCPVEPTRDKIEGLTEQRARSAIDTRLKQRGLRQAAAGAPSDLNVVFRARTDERFFLTPSAGLGYGYGTWMTYGGWPVWYHDFGALFWIELVDAKTDKAVWYGVARDSIGDGVIDQNTIDDAVTEMLAQYPPKSSHY